MKFCNKCKQFKSLDAFGKDKSRKSGLTSACKICRNPESKKWRDNNKEYVKEINARSKKKRAEYYSSPERKMKYRNADLEKRFGINHGEYENMLSAQGGACGICGKLRLSKGKELYGD
jgi:hypothetical protein